MDSEKDKKVKRIARFLELGGTMLAEHCKACGAPRFRYQGKVICPICDVKEEGEEEEAPQPVAKKEVHEAKQYNEKVEPSPEPKKRAQTLRQKPRFGLRTSEVTAGEKKTALEPIEEEKLKNPSVPNQEKTTAQAPQTPQSNQVPPIENTESAETVKVPAVSEDRGSEEREVLEKLLFRKIVSVAAALQEEKSPRSIAEHLELIDKGLELIERLRQL